MSLTPPPPQYKGILAVTRSLGDCAMKDYVVGTPYTQDVKLEASDNILILACDGVTFFLSIFYHKKKNNNKREERRSLAMINKV